MDPLSFRELREVNIRRLPLFKNKHGRLAHSKSDGSDWSPAQWLQAVVGELGEYANIRKKFERGDLSETEFKIEAVNELADVQIYLDLLAFQLKIDLGKAVRSKFNLVSKRVQCDVFLNPPLFEKGNVVRYAEGPTALMQITDVLPGHTGSIARYYGNHCLGDHAVGAYHENITHPTKEDLEMWNAKAHMRRK